MFEHSTPGSDCLSRLLDLLMQANSCVNGVIWGPPMMLLLLGTGLYLSIRTGLFQVRGFGLMCRETLGGIFRRGPVAEGDVTPFQAMTVAMGGTVGVGNIAGVALAIALGGPGAVFWMLVSGVLGMVTKFAEVTLGQHYRRREPGGPMMGGPMMYISRGLGRWGRGLAVAFSVFGALAAFGIGNMVQANAVAEGMEHFSVPRWVTGVVLVVAVGLVTIGGIQRIAHVAMFFVPFMCGLYMLGAAVIIILYAPGIPSVVALIVRDAFTPAAAAGGFAGVGVLAAVRQGLARGMFSNEAGMGSAPIAHATAKTDHPARQGLWGIFEVFVDTLVICFATALVILLTGVWQSGDHGGATLTMQAFGAAFGQRIGFPLVVLSMILTAYDTNLAWCFYGETCAAYLFGHGRVTRTAYRLLWLPLVVLGATGGLRSVWDVSDTLNGLMAIPNLIAVIALAGVVVRLTRGFLAGEPYRPPSS